MSDKKIVELAPFRADMSRSLARRGERLLVATDLADKVADLEPLEAYYIVREIGLNQALPILHHLNQEQLEACIDLDCWNRYDFTVESFDEWVTAFALGGAESLAKAFLSLDYVVQLLFLSQTVTVYDPDTDKIPPLNGVKKQIRATTPDGFYLLELKTDVLLKTHPFTVLDALYQHDYTAAHQLLGQVRVDLPSQIEEEALRFRNDRMQDIGFVSPDEALKLFSRPGIRQPPCRPFEPMVGGSVRVPSVYAGPFVETTLLQRALSLVTDQEWLARLEQEIVWVINGAIIAYGEQSKDIQHITDIAERVRDTISLGLEVLLGQQESDVDLDDGETATMVLLLLEEWSVTDLFQHGFAATMDLKKEALQGLGEPEFQKWFELPEMAQSDEPGDRLERAFVSALLGHHTLYGGFDLAQADKVKAFACLADINVAHGRLKRLVSQCCQS